MAFNDLTPNDKKTTEKVTEQITTKRDNNFEDNWRDHSGGNQYRYGNQRTNRHDHQRSGINGNWRIRNGDNPERDYQETLRSTRQDKGTSENLCKEESYSENYVNGCWSIFSNKWKESTDVWIAVEELHIEQTHLFPVPPKRWSKFNYSMEFIDAYTSKACTKTQIKEAADAIREKVSFPYVMLYFEALLEEDKLPKYLHTPENEFYEFGNGLWRISLIEEANSDNDESSFKDSKSEKSLSLKVKSATKGSPWRNEPLACNSSINTVVSPSQANDQYIYYPQTAEAISKMSSRFGGKWLVYTGFSLAKQNSMWRTLLPLCTEGILIGMKASTALITDGQHFMGGEAILCYTMDSSDMNEVKKAGDAIRKALKMYSEVSEYIMYYKTNNSSTEGRYRRHGCKTVSSYMQTVKGTFYVRDQYKRWILTEL